MRATAGTKRLSNSSELPEVTTTIRELAGTLSSVCRDPSFAARLEILAKT